MSPAFATDSQGAFATLRQLARRRSAVEHCELCSRELPSEHTHLVEIITRRLVCACEPCAILFAGQSNKKYKRVPRRVEFLRDFQISDAQWDSLMVPIEMAFFLRSSLQEKVVALYPSPAGPTESLLPLDTWADIALVNPMLNELEPDTTALLVNRVGYARGSAPAEYYLVPIDECYRLVGIIRTHWRGFSGSTEVWRELAKFFAELKKRAGVFEEAAHA